MGRASAAQGGFQMVFMSFLLAKFMGTGTSLMVLDKITISTLQPKSESPGSPIGTIPAVLLFARIGINEF